MVHRVDHYLVSAAFASFVAIVALWFLVNREYGVYVGLWVPSGVILWAASARVVLFACAAADLRRRK